MGDLGEIGVRDPDFPCEEFDTRTSLRSGRCDGDGHYLCVSCIHHNATADRPTFTRHHLPLVRHG